MASTIQDPPKTTHKSPISLLPLELLLIIMEFMWNRSPMQRINLSRCSLVCKKWRPIAQALLFTEVVLHRESTAKSFLSALNSNLSLGRVTRILSVRASPGNGDSGLPARFCKLRPDLIKAITAKCPGLYHVVLEVPIRMEGVVLKGILQSQTLERLQALDLVLDTNSSIMSTLTLQDILQFLSKFSALSHLHITNISLVVERENDSQLDVPPPQFQLFEFGWATDRFSGHPGNVKIFKIFSDWLFGDSSEVLRVLDLNESCPEAANEIFRSFIFRHGRKLTSIRTSITAEDLLSIAPSFSKKCPDLRELILPNVTLTPSDLLSILATPNLEHLALGRITEEEEAGLKCIDWVMSLPNLQYLTIGRMERFKGSEMWRQQLAGHLHLEFLYEVNLLRKDDRIQTSHFPRGKTIYNFRRMAISSLDDGRIS
ncbi:hypothetical protein FRC02_003070 [Tulasnella sp. 418]|nr:hypothetical protein FRC02_003070 [Tulasnella sp. 418]